MNQSELEQLIQKFCPSLIDYVKSGKPKWKKVLQRYSKREGNIEIEKKTNGKAVVETCFFDLLQGAERGDHSCKSFLKEIDSVVSELRGLVGVKNQDGLKKIIKGMLSSFDSEVMPRPNPAYLNSIGELASLLVILKKSDFELLQFEKKIQNGKHIDFYLKNKITGFEIFIEVVNIHLDDTVPYDEISVGDVVEKKIDDKIKCTTKGISHLNDIERDLNFLAMVWCDLETLNDNRQFFEDFAEKYYKLLQPCIILQYRENLSNDYKYIFGTITSILEKFSK